LEKLVSSGIQARLCRNEGEPIMERVFDSLLLSAFKLVRLSTFEDFVGPIFRVSLLFRSNKTKKGGKDAKRVKKKKKMNSCSFLLEP